MVAAYTRLTIAMVELADRYSPLYRLYHAPQTKPVESAMEEAIVEAHTDFTGRAWVFRQIDAWLEAPGPLVFVITGEPGSGKTALAAHLAQMMQVEALTQKYTHLGPDTLAYAHFCQAFDDRTLSPLRFVTNLSQRLANRYPSFATALLQSSSKEVHITASQTVGTVEPGGSVAGIMIEAVQVGNLSARVAFDELVRRPLEYLSPPTATGPSSSSWTGWMPR